jgi:hypothetical protein
MTLQGIQGVLPWPPVYYGRGGWDLLNNVVIDAAGEGHGLVFAAPATGNLAKIGWRTVTVTTPDDLDVRLETVSTSTGLPSGTLWDSPTNNAHVVVSSPASNTLYESTLISAQAVTAGDMLAAIIVGDTGFAGSLQLAGTDSIEMTGLVGLIPELPYVVNNTGSWAKQATFRMVMWVTYDDGTVYPIGSYFGSPTTTSFNSSSTPDEVGIVFQVPFPCRATGWWVSAELDNTLDIKLYGPSTLTYSFDPDIRRSTVDGFYTGYFSSTVDLAISTDYRLTLLPGASNIIRHNTTLLNAAVRGAWPGGTNIAGTTRSDAGEWSADQTTTTYPMGILIDQLDDAAGGGGRRPAIQLFGN